LEGEAARWVLRVPLAPPGPGVHREREQVLHACAADAGLAPPVLYAEADTGVLITPFIEAPAESSPPSIDVIARLLRRLHGLEAPAPTAATAALWEPLNSADRLDTWRRQLAHRDPVNALSGETREALATAQERTRSRPEAGAICHNDLLAANRRLDRDGRLWALDWEYACPGDPFFDLAGVASELAPQGRDPLLGAGALGSALAYWMQERAQPFCLITRDGGPYQRVAEGDHAIDLPTRSLSSLDEGRVRRLLVTTKAGHLEAAITEVLPCLAEDAVALTLANGLGFATTYARPAGALPLHRAVSTAAAYRDEKGVVRIAARGETRVGVTGLSSPPFWFDAGLAGLPGWTWDPAIDAAVHAKFAVNCVINPLTALHRCRNGELLDGDEAGEELAALARETEQILRNLNLWPGGESLVERAAAVCRVTAPNRSSMLQDVLAGRPTELPFLTGELLRRCRAAQIDAPRSERLYNALQEAGVA